MSHLHEQTDDRARSPERMAAEDALDLARLAVRTERYGDAEETLRALLAGLRPGAVEPATAAAAVRLFAETLYLAGQYEECLAVCAQAVAGGWLAVDDSEAALLRGWIELRRGQAGPARDLAARHLHGRAGGGDPALHAQLLHLRGLSDHRLGRPRAARRDLRDAVALFRLAGDQAGAAEALNALGIVEKTAGNLKRAAACFAEALRLNRQLGLAGRRAQNLLNLALVRLKSGETAAALPLLREARAIQVERKARQSLLRIRIALARAILQGGDPDGARAELAPAFAEAGDCRHAREEGIALETLGDISLACGHHGAARRAYERALTVATKLAPGGDLVAEVRRRLGELSLAEGNATAAVAGLRRAIRAAGACGERFEEGIARRLLAQAYLAQGQWGRAYRTCRAGLETLRDLGAGLEVARCQLVAATIRFAWWEAAGQADGDDVQDCPGGADHRHREAAWSYAIDAFHGFDGLACLREREACAALMARMQAESGAPMTRIQAGGPETTCAATGAEEFIARAPGMQRLLRLARVAAGSDEPVLIIGETGTGKELIARLVHAGGPRARGPFVAVNCAAIPETLFEREFFGTSRGAYTGADSDRSGLCEAAAGGTLFLDEIGDMPLPMQAKLLRLLQEGTFRRLGEPGERRADLRVAAATNADLETLIAQRRFRQDLFYRMQTLELALPPLRERGEDLEPLIALFVQRAVGPQARPADLFEPEVLATLRRYPWPGNVRELEAMTRRLALLATHAGRATAEMLPPAIARWRDRGSAVRSELNLARCLERAERDQIAGVLALMAGNRTEAARRLGISRNALYKKMARLGIAGMTLAGTA